MQATPGEIDAILISRLLRSDDRVLIGAGLPAPRAGALLAALTHASGLRVSQSLAWLSLESGSPPPVPRSGMDVSAPVGAEALQLDHEVFDDVERLSTFFVLGGLEIDSRGATNLLGLRRGDRWERRGPGSFGTTSMASLARRTVVYSVRHTPEVIVERCALRSTPGWQPERGIEGPMQAITPLGVFDFPPPERRMRLLHYRPGSSPEMVRQQTGFEPDGLDEATELPEPGGDEVESLRTRVDPEGQLR